MDEGRAKLRLRLALALPLVASLALFVGLRFHSTTDIQAFLPRERGPDLSVLSRKLAESELSRTMVLVLSREGGEVSLAAANRDLEEALRREPALRTALDFVEGGPREGAERALWELYPPRVLSFLAPDAERAREAITPEGVRTALQHLRQELAGPMSTLVSRVAEGDPFLVLPSLFQRLQKGQGASLKVEEGRYFSASGEQSLLFLATSTSAFDARAQAPILAAIEHAFAQVDRRHGGMLHLDKSGIHRFTLRSAEAIEQDIKRVSILSFALIAFLLLLLFRSLRLLLLASLPLGTGLLAGSALVLALFGRIHGITLAFGASLIGVSIDYVIHLYVEYALAPQARDPLESLRRIRPALRTGALTTLAGFAALAASPLQGLREVACFALSGVGAAFLCTEMLLPLMLPQQIAAWSWRTRLVEGLGAAFSALEYRRRLLWFLPALAFLVSAVTLPKLTFDKDFAHLDRLDSALLAEEERVRKITGFEQARFVVALADDDDQALERAERAHALLAGAVAAGELDAYRGISDLLPSVQTQRAVAEVSTSDPSLSTRLRAELLAQGFEAEAFSAFFDRLRGPQSAPLRFSDLQRTPLAPWVRPFRVQLGKQVAFLLLLQGVRRPEAIEARLRGQEGLVFFRQADLMSATQRLYLQGTSQGLLWGLLAVAALLVLRYRNLRQSAAALLPALLALGLTLSFLTWLGWGLDLVTLTGLLFVVSMGVDYGVFLVDAYGQRGESFDAALTSVSLACLTTVGGFGLLAFSAHPILATLGLSAALGIALSWLLAPAALLLLHRPKPLQ